jgi:hypothetical protein
MSARVLIPVLLILLPICLPSAQYYLAVEYPISPGFYFAEVNGVKIYDPSQAVYVKPGDIIEGFFDVRVVNVRGGPWITPVIGTASWTRGSFSCITNDAPDGESIQSYHFRLKAPETPGTYYIGIFAGWMYTCEEVASNDHPPQFNDGDDVWDMSQSDWESIISTGKASKYGQPGRAIRIVVSGAPSIQVDVWTDRGGKGVGNLDGGRYRIGESAIFYCSINGDASYLKVWIEKPDGSIVTLFENFNVKAGTYEFKGVMGEPEGERKLKAVACPAGQSCKSEDMLSRDEVRYYVEGGAKLEISHNFPSEVYQGQEFSVSVTVRNSGNIEVRNVASGIWWADDAFKGMGCTGTDKRDSLKPGEYMQYSCKLKAIGSPGTYDVEISAFADGGISASSKFKVRISQVQDKEPPKVRVIFPNGGETLYIGEAYKITWEATDNVKVEKVHIWLFQGGRQVSTIVTDNPNTGYFVWIPNMEGKFRIRVAAVDPSGNSAYDDSDSDFNVVPKGAENKPPTAYIDSISPNPAYEGQTIYFSGHGYDPDGSIAGCEWRTDGTVLSSSCSFSTSLPPGKYTIYFRVKDDKGAWSKWVYADLVVKEVSTTERLKLLEKIQGIYEEVYKSLDEGKIALDTQIKFENMFIDMWKDLIEILGSGDIDSLDTVKKLFEMMIGAIEKLDEEGKLLFLQLRLIELNKYGIKDKINELIKLIEEEKQALRNGDLKRVGEVRDRERRILAEIQVNLGPVKSHISNLMRKYTESLCGQEISEWWKEYSMKKGEKRTRTITLNEKSNEIIVSIRVENRPWLFWGDSFKVKVSDPLGLLPTLGVPTEVSVAGDGDILFIAWKDQTKLDSLRKMYKDLNQVAKLTVEVECENLMSFLGSGWFPKEPDVKVIVKTREGCGTVEHPTKYEEYAYNYLNNYITLLEKTAEANLRLLSKG